MILKSLLIKDDIIHSKLSNIFKDKTIYFYILFILILSEIMVMKVYPFIGLADGFTRWEMTKELLNDGKVTSDTVLSPIIPLIQLITYKLSESYGLFTLIQTVIFYLCIGVTTFFLYSQRNICIGKRKIPIWLTVSLCILSYPTVNIFPLLLTDSAFVFCGLVIMTISFYYIYISKNVIFWSVIICISIFFTVSLRVNAITVSIGLAMLGIAVFKGLKKILPILFIIFTLVAILFSNSFLETKYHAETFGMLWELTAIAKNNNDSNLYYDLKKIGDVDKAIKIYRDDFCNNIIWDNDPPFPGFKVSKREEAIKIRKLYLSTLIKKPNEFIKNKIHFIDRVLGISVQLIDPSRGINYVDERIKEYGALDTTINNSVRTNFIEFTRKINLIALRPYILFSISLILIIIKYYSCKILNIKYVIIYVVSWLNYSGFILNTQAHEFRYFAPSFFLLIILVADIIFDTVNIYMNKFIAHIFE